MRAWNDTIFGNATEYYGLDNVQYFMDGSSGILDNCRYVKERIKAWAYVYRMTNNTKWVDRAVKELDVRSLAFFYGRLSLMLPLARSWHRFRSQQLYKVESLSLPRHG